MNFKEKNRLTVHLLNQNGRSDVAVKKPLLTLHPYKNTPEFTIVSILESVKGFQNQGYVIAQCIYHTETKLNWLVPLKDHINYLKEFHDIVQSAHGGAIENAVKAIYEYTRFRINLDWPGILTDEQVNTNIGYLETQIFKPI